MADTMEKLNFKKRKVIFAQGDAADCMYKIEFGAVDIYLNYKTPQQKLINSLTAGQYFGEMALLDDTVRSATAVSASDETVLRVYKKEQLSEMLVSNSASFRELLAQMSQNLYHLTDKYLEVCRTIASYQAYDDKDEPLPTDLWQKLQEYAELYMQY